MFFQENSPPAKILVFSPDGKWLASAGFESLIRIWDVGKGKESLCLSGHTGVVRSLAFSPCGKKIVSSGDQTVRLWEVATGKEIWKVFLPQSPIKIFVTAVAYHPNGKWIAGGGGAWTSPLVFWEESSRRELVSLKGININRLVFSPDGKYLAASGRTHLTVWEIDFNLKKE